MLKTDWNMEEMKEIQEKQERQEVQETTQQPDPVPEEKQMLCPCCGRFYFSGENTFEICEVCGWENNRVQTEYPDFAGGANHMSLNEARESFLAGKQVR